MSSARDPQRPPILLTGATGYIGGRLLRALEERGERVRCLTRRPEAVTPRRETTTIIAGDVLDLESLRPAMRGVETAYYLVHPMTSAASFEQEDRRCAENFAAAAREAGVRRRHGLLVRPLPRPLVDLQRHAGQDRRGCTVP